MYVNCKQWDGFYQISQNIPQQYQSSNSKNWNQSKFLLFSIVNVNRTTLSFSYCNNDCQEIISPSLNDRPIFLLSPPANFHDGDNESAWQRWFYWRRPLYRYNGFKGVLVAPGDGQHHFLYRAGVY